MLLTASLHIICFFIMSSDSDDDFSYTNSVSVLKNLTKNDVSILDDNDSGDLALFETPEPLQINTKRCTRSLNSLGDFPVEPTAEPITIINDSDECIVLSEEEQNTSLNIISTIDNYLQQKGKAGRGRGKRGKGRKVATTRRVTRNSQKAINEQESNNAPIKLISTVYNIDEPEDYTVEDVNYDVSVKVWWKSQYVEKFTIRRFEKMTVIFEHFAAKESLPEDRLLFTIRDRFVTPSDTPDTLNVNAATIIEGGVLSEKSNYVQSSVQDEDYVELKVQMKDRKHPLLISMKVTDCMDVLMCKCAEELKVAIRDLKFFFDGDLVKKNDTPANLELEGGECIDCVKK